MIPDQLPEFNPQKSPTFRAIIEMEGLGTLQPAPSTHTQTIKAPAPTQKLGHSTAPTSHVSPYLSKLPSIAAGCCKTCNFLKNFINHFQN